MTAISARLERRHRNILGYLEETIVAMANNLKLATIAEGVETAAQAEKLRTLGCHHCQGYYFSKPIPAAHCRALLEQLGVARRFTDTVKVRAFRSIKTA